MTSPLAEAREYLEAALAPVAEALDVSLYVGAPEVVTLPAITLTPDPSSWITAGTSGKRRATYRVTVLVSFRGGNVEALDELEAIAWAVYTALPGAGVTDGPRQHKLGQADAYGVSIPVPILVSDT